MEEQPSQEARRPRVWWWSRVEGRSRVEEFQQRVGFAEEFSLSPSRECDLWVVETDEVEPAREELSPAACPVLWLLPHEQVGEVLPWLNSAHEVLTWDTPMSLLCFRLQRMWSRWQREVHELSTKDPLTGVWNRLHFHRRFELVLPKIQAGMVHSLLLLDVDHFKRINDAYGHQSGDEVLRELARRLGESSPSSRVARVGGEEFALLAEADPEQAMWLAHRLLDAVSQEEFALSDGRRLEVRVSIGVCTSDGDATRESMLQAASEALYAAKARGRNRALHIGQIHREALDKGSRPELENFENITKVLTERVGEIIAWRGRQIFEKIREQADVDALTGLYSRRYFDRRLPFEFEVSSQKARPLVVALLDVDFFGRVNKTYGWPTGDQVLMEVAQRIQDNVRAGDWVARYGGEEICIVMQDCSLEQAKVALERIRQRVASEPFATTQGETLQVTVSIGVAQRMPQDPDLAHLIERVSTRLLTAKDSGRNQVAC